MPKAKCTHICMPRYTHAWMYTHTLIWCLTVWRPKMTQPSSLWHQGNSSGSWEKEGLGKCLHSTGRMEFILAHTRGSWSWLHIGIFSGALKNTDVYILVSLEPGKSYESEFLKKPPRWLYCAAHIEGHFFRPLLSSSVATSCVWLPNTWYVARQNWNEF